MNGFLLINKEKDYTSRDIVNIVGKALETKKAGHTGTLDPMAEGLLIICVGAGTKLIELMEHDEKEYIATVLLGIKTDTGDVTGKVLDEQSADVTIDQVKSAIASMKGSYEQTVPAYSAVKINGKRLYDLARNNIEVNLPSRMVTIKEIELISEMKKESEGVVFQIRTTVSKGTYIRSLIEDLAKKLNTVGTMKELKRTKVGHFSLKDAVSIQDIKEKKFTVRELQEILSKYPKVTIEDEEMLFKLKNGQVLHNIYKETPVLFVTKDKKEIALYQEKAGEPEKIKPWKMFL